MGGILYSSSDRTGVEASGVYEGIIQEDMIDTVKRVKKYFIDVYIKDLFFQDSDYPLTFVPVFNMVLPLKKGQKVWVYFNQENHRYPVLWKIDSDISVASLDFSKPQSEDLFIFSNSTLVTESKGKTYIKAAGIDLGEELYKFFDKLLTTAPHTQGSPAAQFLHPDIIIALTELVTKISMSFKG